MAELDPLVARLAGLGEAGVERDVAAQLRQIVVASSDGADAEADGHRLAPCPAFSAVELSPTRRGIATANSGCLLFAEDSGLPRPMKKTARDIVVFDLGGVLIDWDPRHLYRKLFAGDEAAMEHFLATVCTHEWNRGQDAGRTFAEGARLLKAEHPDKAGLIDAYCTRFDEMMPGPITGSVDILADLKSSGAPSIA